VNANRNGFVTNNEQIKKVQRAGTSTPQNTIPTGEFIIMTKYGGCALNFSGIAELA